MKIVAIIQARMGSERLPDKVMRHIGNDPVIGHVIKRVRKINNLNDIVVATTNLFEDQRIVDYCRDIDVNCYRGSSNNVLERFYRAALFSSADTVIRITADCPLLDPKVSFETLDLFLRKKSDYVSNVHPPTYPDGMDTEVFTFGSLEIVYKSANKDYQKEHVTPYIYENPDVFKIYNHQSKKDLSGFRFVVDNEDDFTFMQKIYEVYGNSFYTVDHENLVECLIQHPDLKSIKLSGRRNEKY